MKMFCKICFRGLDKLKPVQILKEYFKNVRK